MNFSFLLSDFENSKWKPLKKRKNEKKYSLFETKSEIEEKPGGNKQMLTGKLY